MLPDGRVQTITRDITERKAYQRRLEEHADSQTQLLHQLMTAQEAERRRLSMDIHDGPLQSLGVAIMELDRAVRRQDRGEPEKARSELVSLRSTLANTVSEVRAVLADLSLEILTAYGLSSALRNHIEHFSEVTGIKGKLRNSVKRRLPPPVELLMYRLAQEALSNVRKHAQAQHVDVSLKIIGEKLCMIVADDGRGFNVDAAMRERFAGEKVGLKSMQQRIRDAQGDLVIDSAPGQGTTLSFWCPLPHREKGR
jgi:two-component system sensor histidine kinase DegS